MIKGHTLEIQWHNYELSCGPTYKIECPHEPNDPNRLCLIFDPDNPSDTEDGCVVQQWLDADVDTCMLNLIVKVPIIAEFTGDGWHLNEGSL